MTMHIPKDLENSIIAAVDSGRYASLDDAMTEAASMLVQRLKQEQEFKNATSPAAGLIEAGQAQKPAWERVLKRTAGIPDEEWNKLPTDLAEQHDHYLYGTAKRPTA